MLEVYVSFKKSVLLSGDLVRALMLSGASSTDLFALPLFWGTSTKTFVHHKVDNVNLRGRTRQEHRWLEEETIGTFFLSSDKRTLGLQTRLERSGYRPQKLFHLVRATCEEVM